MAKGMKFKKANKNATKGKNKMWKKGQSCSYNPQFNKHRQEAKKRGIFESQGKGKLTEALLLQHNKMTTGICEDDDNMSVGADTALTAFTCCSLPTFTRLLKTWDTNSFLHKEMVAVLAAVTDVLKTQGGKETETEYFAALMSTLDIVDTDEGVTAVVSLLAMIVKKLNESVLKVNSKSSCETFSKLLIKYMNTDNCSLLRNLLNIVYTFLKVKNLWTDSTDEFSVVLEFTTHHKPKVRRIAKHIVKTILTDYIPTPMTVHPAANVVSSFCIEKLEKQSGKSADSRSVFYALSLLQEVISVFSKVSIKKSCETIFRVMTLSNTIMTVNCLRAIQGLFASNPNPENLPVDLNARIITALYDFQPNVKDTQSLICWNQLMHSALMNLFNLDERLCISHLPKFYSVSVKCLLNENDNVQAAIASTLTDILRECIKPNSEVFQQLLFEDPINNAVHKMFHHVEGALNYQYHGAWKYVLNILSKFFEVVGRQSYTVMAKCLQSLAELHDSYQFSCVPELERAIGCAVKTMGPQIVLQSIPLQLDVGSEKPDFPRSWMLLLLRDNIRNTQLEYFIKYFLPLAAKMRNKSLILLQERKEVESKLYNVVCSQIWSLLPGFCTEPTDLKECFREVAKTLGLILKDDSALRMTILGSLRLLISKNLENEENKQEIGAFAKNYLPILFNLYTTESKNKEEEKVRLAVFETCKAYLQISSKELCEKFFDVALEKLSSSSSEVFMQNALLDLSRAIFPFCSINKVEALFTYCRPLLKNSNHTVQKKVYSIIKEVCCSKSESCKAFVSAHLEDLKTLLSGNATGLTPSARALRLNCLQHIVSQISKEQEDFIKEIIPEAILCTKENSVRARSVAFDLLCTIGETFKRYNPENPNDAIRDYMASLLAGLAGSPHMISATILAIGRVMFEFKDDLDSKITHLLIENMCLLLTSKSREVALSSMSFLKILFKTVDTSVLAEHIEYMVKSITNISEDHQRQFRFKAKEIFTRLVRKFGYEMISKMVPENYQKQLVNIRKLEARRLRNKNFVDDRSENVSDGFVKRENFDDIIADSDDEEIIEEYSERPEKADRKKKSTTVIEEKGEDDIVDFLDPTVNKRLLGAKPQKIEKSIKNANSFPISEDGRMVIEEEDDKKSTTKVEKKEDIKDEVLRELGATKKNNKRKLDESDEEDGPKTVGKGIHRNVPPRKKLQPGHEFKAKKAGGDIKKGKFEPYAYMPLNPQSLNRRKQIKLKGQYKNIVKGAKKGAMSGLKKKAKESKKRKWTH